MRKWWRINAHAIGIRSGGECGDRSRVGVRGRQRALVLVLVLVKLVLVQRVAQDNTHLLTHQRFVKVFVQQSAKQFAIVVLFVIA